MRFSFGAVALLFFAAVISVTAQKRTITNADLEKYKQERARAEKEYMDTYQQLGRPSPAELRQQRDESLASTARVAEMLMEQEFERERIELRREQTRRYDDVSGRQYYESYTGIAPAYFYGGYGFGGFGAYGVGNNPRGRSRFAPYRQPYEVSGGSIILVGPRTRSAPLMATPRTRPRR
jgi:hypothetical protein